MTEQYRLLHTIKYYRDCLNSDIRPDGRGLDNFRPVSINVNSFSTADGSAVVKIGNTTVVCGIKAELSPPKSTEPEHGFVVPSIELSPLCSPKYRPGPPTEDAQIYSSSLAEIVTNSGCIDLKQLCIVKEKLVWVLYCDLVCFDHDGCILDAAVIALVAALNTLTLPEVIYDNDTHIFKVNEDVRKLINVNHTPVSTSFMVFDDNFVISDPNGKEEEHSSASVSVVVANSEICFVHKPGGSPLTPKQLEKCLFQSIEREKYVCSLLAKIIKSK